MFGVFDCLLLQVLKRVVIAVINAQLKLYHNVVDVIG